MGSKHEVKSNVSQDMPLDAGSNEYAVIAWLLGELPSLTNKSSECGDGSKCAAYGYTEDATIPADVARRLQLVGGLKPLAGNRGVSIVPVERIVHGLVQEAFKRGITEPVPLEVYVGRGLADCGSDVDPDEVPHLIEQSIANQQAVQPPPVKRRGRGRPIDENFGKWAYGRYQVLGNATRVAHEAADQFDIAVEAALKRIRRAAWYRAAAPAPAMPPPADSPAPTLKRAPVPSSQHAAPARQRSLADAIDNYLRLHSPAKAGIIAAALGARLRDVSQALRDPNRFRYLLGELWERA